MSRAEKIRLKSIELKQVLEHLRRFADPNLYSFIGKLVGHIYAIDHELEETRRQLKSLLQPDMFKKEADIQAQYNAFKLEEPIKWPHRGERLYNKKQYYPAWKMTSEEISIANEWALGEGLKLLQVEGHDNDNIENV